MGFGTRYCLLAVCSLLAPVLGSKNLVFLTPNLSQVTEGQEVELTCTASCFPYNSTIRWSLGPQPFNSSESSYYSNVKGNCVDTVKTITIFPSRSMQRTLEVVCKVLNPLVDLNKTFEARSSLTILGPPMVTTICVRDGETCEECRNCTRTVTRGDSLEIKCSALDSNPVSYLHWKIESRISNQDDTAVLPSVVAYNVTDLGDSISSINISTAPSNGGVSVRIVCCILYPNNRTTFTEEYVNLEIVEPTDEGYIWKLVFISNGCLVVVILTACLCCVCVRTMRARKRRKWTRRKGGQEDVSSPVIELTRVEMITNQGKVEEPEGEECAPPGDDLEFPRQRLTLLWLIGSGNFGQVHKALAKGIVRNGESTVVAVKTIRGDSGQLATSEFKNELDIFRSLERHPYVVSILGCCTKTAPYYMIMEFVPNGTLEAFIRKKLRAWNANMGLPIGTSPIMNEPLSAVQILTFAFQIANGMEYLASKHLVHRDLATRNVLLAEGLICKLCDFGLARDVTGNNQYDMLSDSAVPVRWLAIECLLQNIYTTKSDVWSFGVLLWELVTLGALPYPNMSTNTIVESIKHGQRLPRPAHCGATLYRLMSSCWNNWPQRRPTFALLQTILDRFLKHISLRGILEMSEFVAQEPYA